jgi:hypothetical protein
VALAKASKGNCILSVKIHNNKVAWHCAEPASKPAGTSVSSDAAQLSVINPPAAHYAASPSTAGDVTGLANLWLQASRCHHAPDLTNSIPDPESRLWGEEQQKPCAYRADDNTPMLYHGFLPLKFETTPACNSLPTATNSMPDKQGRLFGWDQSQQEYCAFKDASTGQPVYPPSPSAASPNTPEDAGPELAPSAAGVPGSSLPVPAAWQGMAMVKEAAAACGAQCATGCSYLIGCINSDPPNLCVLQVPSVTM